MPESPEVKLLIESIRPHIIGQAILNAQVISGKYITKQKIKNWGHLQDHLPLKIIEVGTHGKFIYFRLEKDVAIGVGLGMVGTFKFTLNEKHNRIRLGLGNRMTLYYDDYRNFGNWEVFTSWAQLNKKISKLGLDLLSEYPLNLLEINRIYTHHRHQNICQVLMNQDLISGIGVWIKCEALYREKICPLINVGDLTPEQFTSLILSAREIAQLAYNYQKGRGIDYRGYNGSGSDKRRDLLLVYDQKTDPNGYSVVKIQTPDKRTTSYVPEVQTIPFGFKQVEAIVNDMILEDEIIEGNNDMVIDDEIIDDDIIDEEIDFKDEILETSEHF